MQLKSFLVGCLSLAVATGASAQVEYDDMYFNSADRAEMKALQGQSLAMTGKKKKALMEEDFANPTDSYSARNISPEYVSRSNADEARADEQDYFVTNYNQKTAAGYSAWNNQFNNWYNSPWYSTGWYNVGGWSPYYGHMYSPYYYDWGSPWYDPYYGYGSGWNYGYGSGWSLGYGLSFGYHPWHSWGWGLSSGYGWYNSWYPSTVVIVDNGTSGRVHYGKRPTRGAAAYNNSTVTNSRTRSNVTTPPSYTRPNTGGRTTSTITTSAPTTGQSSHYNKNWRSAAQTAPSRSSTWSSGSNSRSGYNSGSYDRGSSSPSYSPSPSRSYGGSSGYSGGSSGSSGSSGGGGSNGRTRGSR